MSERTPEEEEALSRLAGAYVVVEKVGKFLAYCFVGLLGFIVLVSQAWDVIKAKFGFH